MTDKSTISLISEMKSNPVEANIENIRENQYLLNIGDDYFSIEFWKASRKSGFIRNVQTNETIPFYFTIQSDESNDIVHLWIRGRIYKFTSLKSDTFSEVLRKAKSTHIFSEEVRSPMPGTILKIAVEIGQNVKANEPIIIMESMKMEMTVSAPADSIVENVFCTAGQLVEMNSVLVKLKQVEDENIS